MLNLLSAAVVDLGGTYFAIVDLVLIGCILIAGIVGAIQGFLRQILSILGVVAAVIISGVFCQVFAEILTSTFPGITDSIAAEVNAMFNLDAILSGTATREAIIEALQTTSLPAFTFDLIADLIINYAGEIQISSIVAEWVVVGISFVVLFIASLIVFAFIKKFLIALTKLPIIGAINTILGAVFSIVKILIVIIVFAVLLSLLIPNINDIFNPTLENGEMINSMLSQLLEFVMSLSFI